MSANLSALKAKINLDKKEVYNQEENLGLYFLDSAKKALKYRFFLYVNIFLILSILLACLAVRLNQTVDNTKLSSSRWTQIAKTFLDMNLADKDKSISEIRAEVKTILKPVGKFTGTETLINSQIDEFNQLSLEWLDLVGPLLEYRFSLEGLISAKSNNNNFTDDLEKVLNNSQSLILKTKQKWNSLLFIRAILSTLGTDKIKIVLHSIDNLIGFSDEVYNLREQILQILGHQTRQRILIFNQNIGEARPTGGFIGSYIPVEVFKGRINIGQSQTIYKIDDSKPKPLLTHPANWYYAVDYAGVGESGIRNINYFPCFPTTAKALKREFATSSQGFSSDVIVFLNPQFLQALWPEDLTIEVAEVGEINKYNFLTQIERLTSPSLLAKDIKNPKAEITPIVEGIISNFSKTINSNGVSSIISKVAVALLARNLQIWFNNNTIQNVWENTGLAGRQTCNTSSDIPAVSFLLANLSGDKRSLITKNQFNIYSESVWGGANIYVNYKQIIPEKPDLLRGFNNTTPLSFVGLQVPKNATKLRVHGEQILDLPALRAGFVNKVSVINNTEPKILDEAKIIQESMIDLEKGFTYFQPDGSQVIGAYIRDEQVSNVGFSFFLPDSNNISSRVINFYPQPGLVNTDLSLGNGTFFKDFPELKYINNQDSVAIGKTLLLR